MYTERNSLYFLHKKVYNLKESCFNLIKVSESLSYRFYCCNKETRKRERKKVHVFPDTMFHIEISSTHFCSVLFKGYHTEFLPESLKTVELQAHL
jgi:hypothetical protein